MENLFDRVKISQCIGILELKYSARELSISLGVIRLIRVTSITGGENERFRLSSPRSQQLVNNLTRC